MKQINKPVGVIGTGRFGVTIAKLLAYKNDVLIYGRNIDLVNTINNTHTLRGVLLDPKIKATNSLEEVALSCNLIYPIVPSSNFKEMIQHLAPYLRPDHILIHGTKGLDLIGVDENNLADAIITRSNIRTMSEIITQDTVVKRVGCLSGPNLAKEILENQPTATVIASQFNEVIKRGEESLNSNFFFVFGSHDILGAEISGALKNIIALGSGILGGKGLGKNVQAMLITRGLHEMVQFGKAMGAESRSFFGTSGIGDLVATATSTDSRNYSFGVRLANGETVEEIRNSMQEIAEGVRTLKIAQQLATHYKLSVPITQMLYQVVFKDYDVLKAIHQLMRYPLAEDVSF